jgi:hypothetical protein
MVRVDWVKNRGTQGGREAFPTLIEAAEWAIVKEAYGELYVTSVTDDGREVSRDEWQGLED